MTVNHALYAPQLKSALLPAQCMSDLTLTVVSMDGVDQFRFPGNFPPTTPLTQRSHLRLTWGKMLG